MLRVLIAGVLAGAIGIASAKEPPSPSEVDIRRALDASRAAIGAAKRSLPTPTEETRMVGAATAGTLRAALQPPPGTNDRAAADIRALMARARTGGFFDAKTPPSAAPRPLVFVSMSMPEPSLRALVDQSRPVGAALVLRGLVDDSMQRTAERLGTLFGADADSISQNRPSSDVSLMIHPTLFERFEVDAVPTFVVPLEVPAPCTTGGACPTPAHAKLAGDVTLPYALEVVSREATDRGIRAAAAEWSRKSGRPK